MYAAKCYWPGVTRTDLEQIAARADARLSTGRSGVTYLGSLLFATDDLVLCLFLGPSRAAVIQASERLGIPSERLMDAAWLGPGPPAEEEMQVHTDGSGTPQWGPACGWKYEAPSQGVVAAVDQRLRCLWCRLRLTISEMNHAAGGSSSSSRHG
jgi:hypothetical protein